MPAPKFDVSSLFAQNTSPEDVAAAGGEPARQTHRVPVLSVVLQDAPGGRPPVTPAAYAKKGLSLAFPMLVPAGGGDLIEIKYLNRWTKNSSGTGSRSVPTERGYKGFAGKQLTFTAVFDDALPREYSDNVVPYYTSEIIELLRLWAITEVTQIISPTAYTSAILKIKQYVSPEEQDKIVKAFKDSFETAKGKETFTANYGAITQAQTIRRVSKSQLTTVAPLPPAPLRFQVGNLVLPRCVITQMNVTVTRYNGQHATAAEIKIVLQEMLEGSLWTSEAPNPEKLFALRVSATSPTPEPEPTVENSYWERVRWVRQSW